MNSIIKKIDRVSTIEEATRLEDVGANLIGVPLFKNPRFNDEKIVTEDIAISIRQALKTAKVVGEVIVGRNFSETLKLIRKVGVDFVQPIEHEIPPRQFRDELLKDGIGIIYSNIEATYDDDPSWILSRFLNEAELNASYYQIDLLGNVENSWEFLKEECPRYPEELQIKDINDLAKDNSLLITLNYSTDNILEILDYLPNIKGISMVLGNKCQENDIKCFEFTTVLKILNKLKNQKMETIA